MLKISKFTSAEISVMPERLHDNPDVVDHLLVSEGQVREQAVIRMFL
jgi:hypothetical protein